MTTVVDTKLNDYKHDLTKTMTCIIPSVLCKSKIFELLELFSLC